MKRKIFFLLLALSILLIPVLATGESNIDTGGGGLGGGDAGNRWYSGQCGVRVSVVRVSDGAVVGTADFSNADSVLMSYASSIIHFGLTSKLEYIQGRSLSFKESHYEYFSLPGMPSIVTADGSGSVEAIRSFFTLGGTVQNIAENIGMDYYEVINGDYKLLIEPIAYFLHNYEFYAMTAHEAALYDELASGYLRSTMRPLTHQNLPLALFLESDDSSLGLQAWPGSTTASVYNEDILNYLGMGVVSFVEGAATFTGDAVPAEEEEEIEFDVELIGDYEFHTDMDVIVSVTVRNTGARITPDDEVYLSIEIDGTTYNKQFICPSGTRDSPSEQLVWVKWHTPGEPSIVDINISSREMPSLNESFTANIIAFEEIEPPDPTFEDKSNGFSRIDIIDYGSKTTASWSEWTVSWEHMPSTHVSLGSAWTCSEDNCTSPSAHGDWVYERIDYAAYLTASLEVTPDSSVPTAYTARDGVWVMGAGYGVNVTANVTVSASANVTDYDVTPVQGISVLFPEFYYETYNRLMTTTVNTRTVYRNQVWTLKPNQYSFYASPIHFTPLWYPDDDYTVEAVALGAWTPGGMLYATLSDTLYIFNTVLDDWVIRRTD